MKKPISRDTLLANCRVLAGRAGGSGTVLYSAPNTDEGYSTYILTNHHVVDGLIKIEKKWNSLLKRETKAEVFGIAEVHFFKYRWEQRAVGATAIEAEIMAYDPDEDLALLRLRSDEQVKSVAKMLPKGEEKTLAIGTPVMAIGAGLGEPPVLTTGRLSQFGRDIDNREYWLQTAPTIFGNSGGAVFVEETEEFIGVPARIAVMMMGFSADAITHLSFMIPITRVYKFLEDQLFRFIYDSQFTEEGEAKEREARRKAEELLVAAKEQVTGESAEEDTPSDS